MREVRCRPGLNRVERALGRVLEWAIQRWVTTGGRRVAPDAASWLVGPIGAERIGATFYAAYAAEAGLEVDREAPAAGLLPNFSMLASPGFDPAAVCREIRHFYERTSHYNLDVSSQWRGPLRPFAHTLIYLVSRNIQQLNLPMSSLATSDGMSSEVIPLRDRRRGEVRFTAWLRCAAATGQVVYAGFYTAVRPKHEDGAYVKVVFPLPSGSATVLLRPQAQQDGSLNPPERGSVNLAITASTGREAESCECATCHSRRRSTFSEMRRESFAPTTPSLSGACGSSRSTTK